MPEDHGQPAVPPRWQMGAESIDIGPPEPAVYLRIEEDAFGGQYASFATSDGDTFSLDATALRMRIEWLKKQARDASEESRGLRELRVSF